MSTFQIGSAIRLEARLRAFSESGLSLDRAQWLKPNREKPRKRGSVNDAWASGYPP